MRVNWEAIAAIGQMVGAAGVIVSVAYLAIQIRQSTEATRLSAVQSQERAIEAINLAISSHDTLNELLEKGMNRPDQLSAAEGHRLHVFMMQVFRAFESAHRLHLSGLLDAEQWNFHFTAIRNYKGLPGFQGWWNAAGQYFDTPFQSLVASADMGRPVAFDENTHRFLAQSFVQRSRPTAPSGAEDHD